MASIPNKSQLCQDISLQMLNCSHNHVLMLLSNPAVYTQIYTLGINTQIKKTMWKQLQQTCKENMQKSHDSLYQTSCQAFARTHSYIRF